MRRFALALRAIAAALPPSALALWAGAAGATCVAISAAPPRVIPAAYRLAETIAPRQVGITFLGHASFLIESPEGVRIVTDYTDYIGAPVVPDVVTMNNAHSTHFSYAPDPRIAHVLRGWDPGGGVARHDVLVKDVRIRNVPTNLAPRTAGGFTNGNSIFVFEVSGLCVAHIGHLHHVLSEQQERAIGRVDVLMIAVDGMWTMSHVELEDTLRRLRAPLVLPMHFGSSGSIQAFVAIAEELGYAVERAETSAIRLEIGALPRTRTVRFLPGY